jgi:hypothetical protein
VDSLKQMSVTYPDLFKHFQNNCINGSYKNWTTEITITLNLGEVKVPRYLLTYSFAKQQSFKHNFSQGTYYTG